MSEEWRPVPQFPRYEVSTLGRLRSLHPRHPGRILKPTRISDGTNAGYLQVTLWESGLPKGMKMHRVVALAWIPNPEGLPEIRHLDGSRDNNRVENLRWGTPSENTLDQVRHGTHHKARVTHCPQGHPYSGRNLRVVPATGNRVCRTCTNSKDRVNPEPTNQKRTVGPHGYKGVGFEKTSGLYTAQISVGGRSRRIGRFATREDAARAYDAAAYELWGGAARLNFSRSAA